MTQKTEKAMKVRGSSRVAFIIIIPVFMFSLTGSILFQPSISYGESVNFMQKFDKEIAPKGGPSHSRKGSGFIQKFDKDNDGKVSKTEFRGGDVQFNKHDENKDGYIDESEAPKGGPSHSRKGRGFIQKFDKDNDGCVIDVKHVQRDIIGKSVRGWTFKKGEPCRIKILDTKYKRDTGIVHISIKAVRHVHTRSGWVGKEGRLRLEYEYAANDWNLISLKTVSFSNLTRDDVYAVRKTDGHPLLVAVDEGELETVKNLLDKGADPNDRGMKGETALMLAAPRGYVDVAKLLVENGADVDATSKTGLTALMFAASTRQPQMVRFLLAKGADVDRRGPGGCTALLLATQRRPGKLSASEKDAVSIVSALLDKGADVNVRDCTGFTALGLAIKDGKEGVVRILLDEGADANIVTCESGLTPLMDAVTMERPSIVKILLKKGADVSVKKNGVTALSIAKAKKNIELIQILRKAAAKE